MARVNKHSLRAEFDALKARFGRLIQIALAGRAIENLYE